MKYCISCGQQLPDTAKFCSSCGKQIHGDMNQPENQRKIVYDGELHKCPKCGAYLDSFISNCPTCGYELRGIKSTNSVAELAAKLTEIDSNRKNPVFFKNQKTKEDDQKITLIRSFSIPNTKEDLYEFFTLAASNIDVDAYDSSKGAIYHSAAREELSNAWKAKFEQAYHKLKLICKDDPLQNDIELTYQNINKSIRRSKMRVWWIVLATLSPIILMCLFIIISSQS